MRVVRAQLVVALIVCAIVRRRRSADAPSSGAPTPVGGGQRESIYATTTAASQQHQRLPSQSAAGASPLRTSEFVSARASQIYGAAPGEQYSTAPPPNAVVYDLAPRCELPPSARVRALAVR